MLLEPKNTITPAQKKILTIFAGSKNSSDFFLSGATALSGFYYGHRYSYDLDLFTNKKKYIEDFSGFDYVVIPFIESLQGEGVKTEVKKESPMGVKLLAGNTHLSLQCSLFNTLKESEETSLGVWVDSYEDLLGAKTFAFSVRCKQRDAIDLFFMLKKHKISELVSYAKKKNKSFDSYQLQVNMQRVLSDAKRFPKNIQDWDVELALDLNYKEFVDRFEETLDYLVGCNKNK